LNKFINGDIIVQIANEENDYSYFFRVLNFDGKDYWLKSFIHHYNGDEMKAFPSGQKGTENYCRKATDEEVAMVELLYE
jgi:hypothetical protein